MPSPRSPALLLLVAILLSSQLTYAQQANQTPNNQSANAELREKAFNLLASLADQLGTLQSTENRARIGSNIAGSIWTHDEKRARAVFKLVEEHIKTGLQVEKTPEADHTFQVFLRLREDTAERMAQHDPELALAFVKDTALLVNEYARLPSGGILPLVELREHDLELRLAKKVGAANPEVAMKLARQSLAHGFSNDLLPVLRSSSKNKALALKLYKEIVNKLREAKFNEWQTFEFAQNLAQSYTPPAADESTYRELLQIFLTHARNANCDQKWTGEHNDERIAFCSRIAVLTPLLQRFYPVEAGRLRHLIAESAESELMLRQANAELDEVVENGTIEEVLALRSKYPSLEGNILMRAIWMAETAGDWEQAEKIASTHSDDPDARQALNLRLEHYKSMKTMAQQQWEAMQQHVDLVPMPAKRAMLLSLAHQAALRDRKTALEILAQLSHLVDAMPPGKQQTEEQIGLALVYCLVKSDRGFTIMEGLLPQLNELVAAASKLDGYDGRYLSDGEWNMSAASAVGNILTVLANNAAYFAWYDFDRAVTLAGQFERSEIRMMAQLKLAQGILAGPSRRQLNNLVIY
jgi:hypothetical protein